MTLAHTVFHRGAEVQGQLVSGRERDSRTPWPFFGHGGRAFTGLANSCAGAPTALIPEPVSTPASAANLSTLSRIQLESLVRSLTAGHDQNNARENIDERYCTRPGRLCTGSTGSHRVRHARAMVEPLTTWGNCMDRRSFLVRMPTALAGGAATLLTSSQEETPERTELREQLDLATRQYDEARDLIHWPWRYDEAIPLLNSALNGGAQVWLHLRGVRTKENHYTWGFVACNFRDEITGVGWNRAGLACRLLDRHCQYMGRWYGPHGNKRDSQSRGTILMRSRSELLCALDAVAQCLECTRHALNGLTSPLPALTEAPRV